MPLDNDAIDFGRKLYAQGVPLDKIHGGWTRAGWLRAANARPARKARRAGLALARCTGWLLWGMAATAALVVAFSVGLAAGALFGERFHGR